MRRRKVDGDSFREELGDYSWVSSTISKGVKMSKSQGVKRTMGSNHIRYQGIWGQSVYLGT